MRSTPCWERVDETAVGERRARRRIGSALLMLVIFATARDSIANFVYALLVVYTILIIAYIFSSMYFNVGGRIPYSRWSRTILDFLRDVSEPYLSIFRRFIPPFGPLDLSPMIATIVLWLVGSVIINLIQG